MVYSQAIRATHTHSYEMSRQHRILNYNHHQSQFENIFIIQKIISIPINSCSTFLLSADLGNHKSTFYLCLQTCLFYTFHINWIIQYSAFLSGFRLGSFQGSSILQHLSLFHFFLWLNHILLQGYTAFCLVIDQFMDDCVSTIWLIMNNTSRNIQVFMWTYIFNSLGYVPRSTIAWSYSFKCLRNFQIIFQNDCTILQFTLLHQQNMRVPISLPFANTCYFPFF